MELVYGSLKAASSLNGVLRVRCCGFMVNVRVLNTFHDVV